MQIKPISANIAPDNTKANVTHGDGVLHCTTKSVAAVRITLCRQLVAALRRHQGNPTVGVGYQVWMYLLKKVHSFFIKCFLL